jgi:hypothetical protein
LKLFSTISARPGQNATTRPFGEVSANCAEQLREI